ncbi:uncharacterized protein LOC118195299 [Stegodyphus dumicola]|uniref:uncharacterized protein LOC118195299 n=1 Tax=Stegodyphus dumicola TaxID=202533 RepID=UPI0015A7C2AF|nr:uncharacterized protein LOC118195299 [Stegodyphus dumicola]
MPRIFVQDRTYSKKNENSTEIHFNDQQASYYAAKDVEFCPNRAREVMQNYVQETGQNMCNDDPFIETKKIEPAVPMSDRDHMEAYQSGNSVSLYSVMQSNVPEPFSAHGRAPTHLNMPGSSSSQDCKYLSGKLQSTHQSKQ